MVTKLSILFGHLTLSKSFYKANVGCHELLQPHLSFCSPRITIAIPKVKVCGFNQSIFQVWKSRRQLFYSPSRLMHCGFVFSQHAIWKKKKKKTSLSTFCGLWYFTDPHLVKSEHCNTNSWLGYFEGHGSEVQRHTNLRLVGLSVLWKLDELLGEHARTVAQNVALKLDIRVGSEELQDNGVTSGINPNLHILSSDCGRRRTHSYSTMSELFRTVYTEFRIIKCSLPPKGVLSESSFWKPSLF